MKKILLIATGGTIASRKTEGGLAPGLSPQELLRWVLSFQDQAELLEPEDLREILERLAGEAFALPLKERAGQGAALCKEAAARREVDLRLRKPPGKSGK